MSFESKRQRIRGIGGSGIFVRVSITAAIVIGGSLWIAAMMIRYIKGT
jgi:hypothetical protein